ncbi:MAG: hypothetical protein IPM47_05925 [Sphingobacteriales bacterium]|nr:MAG: hypothetical protein IPM47_05925 [Sphingobacteriales bacterium]
MSETSSTYFFGTSPAGFYRFIARYVVFQHADHGNDTISGNAGIFSGILQFCPT